MNNFFIYLKLQYNILPSVPPQWLLEPSDVSVTLGGEALVPCYAKGFPHPSVTWSRETSELWILTFHFAQISPLQENLSVVI